MPPPARPTRCDRPFGCWTSDLVLPQELERGGSPSYPFVVDARLYWLQQPPHSTRIGVVGQTATGHEWVTPPAFNIRSRVHEYGGKCFCVAGDGVVFNNYADNTLYRQSLHSLHPTEPPTALAGTGFADGMGEVIGFADLTATACQRWVIAVAEWCVAAGENRNGLVAIATDPALAPVLLAAGADFYAAPCVGDDRLAWLEWSHPYMPWDQTRLVYAELHASRDTITIAHPTVLIDQADRAVSQIGFHHDRLLFVSDDLGHDYSNFFAYARDRISQITDLPMEFGEPHWQFGQHRWQSIDRQHIIAVGSRAHDERLVTIKVANGDHQIHRTRFAACRQLHFAAPYLWWVAHTAEQLPHLRGWRLTTTRGNDGDRVRGAEDRLEGDLGDDLVVASTRTTTARGLSTPHPIEFAVSDPPTAPPSIPRTAHAWFYPPYSTTHYCGDTTARPPLLVVVHGGPTSRATCEYDGLKQFLCSLGFAMLDVNHRGSSGYGRQFRQSLLGHWGEYDSADIVAAIAAVAARGWINPNLVFIRGSSAGGYAVLRALTQYPERFAGGACYYGIGNLITLSEITHKFESHYTDRLLGEVFDRVTARAPTSRFVTRSPSFAIDQLSSPLILFHGQDDKVVPPAVSQEVVARLDARGIHHAYTEYAGEGHGFKKTTTRVDALTQEIAFYAKIIEQTLV